MSTSLARGIDHFLWVRHHDGRLWPQIMRDPPTGPSGVDIAAAHPLPSEHRDLSLDALAAKYPPPAEAAA